MKKIVSLLLAAVMLLAVVPFGAMADGEQSFSDVGSAVVNDSSSPSSFERDTSSVRGIGAGTNYDYAAAAQYGYDHAYDTPTYSGGDCANFTSHCLAAGGVEIINSSTYYSSSTISYNNCSGPLGNYRNPYIASAAQLLYLSEFYEVITSPSNSQIELGDIVFMNGSSGDPDGHVVIITGFNGSTPLYSGHTNARQNYPLYSGVATFVVKMRNPIGGGNETGESTLSLTNYNYPTAVAEGSAFYLTGTISSNYHLEWVWVGIFNSSGNAVTSKSLTPYTYSVDIATQIDSDIHFTWLTAGQYTYHVEATDVSGNFQVLLSVNFTVYNSSAVPEIPIVSTNKTQYLAGESVTISWNAVANNSFYWINIYKNDSLIVDESMGTNTSYVYANAGVGSYTIYLSANNNAGTSGTSSCSFIVTNPSYTVTFKDWDGTVLKTQTVSYGGSATPPANPTRTGYTFAGWSGTYTNITSNQVVTATYTINTYTVTFKDWDGTVLKTQTVNYGGSATPPSNPSRTGYTFAGWSGTYTDVTSDQVVTATYTINSYTVTFKDWDGTVLKTQTVNYGASATPPADPTRTGYTFAGWSGTYTNVTSDQVVTATYTINTYTVIFKDWDGTVLKTQTVNYGAAATAPADPTREHFTFAGWDKSFNVITSDTVITATYSVILHSGTCGTAVMWECNEYTGELIITGKGNMTDYYFGGMPWNSYRDAITNVQIDDGVTSIGGAAFYGCTSLTSVTIPDSVTSIGSWAFYRCSSLTSVSIPDSVTSIGEYAFYLCTSLTSVTIGNSVTSIGSSAFYRCSSLSEIEVDPANPCYCSVNGVLFNKDATALIQYPAGNPRSEYTIPDSVTSIGSYAFWGCTSLTSVTIPDSVTSIGGHSVFRRCTSLSEIEVDPANPCYCSVNGVLFNKDATALIQYPAGNPRSEYTIPDSVTSIGVGAFSYCTSLSSVTIGNSVTSIGGCAFEGCSLLTSVTIPDSVTSIDEYAFDCCSSLTSVTIGSSVTSIDVGAFWGCSSLTSVTIPDSVTSIGGSAFYGCTSLSSVTIGNGVTYIGSGAFSNCTSLTSVTIPDSVTSIYSHTFYGCTSLTSVTIPDGVTSIGDYAFYGCTSLTSVTFLGAPPASFTSYVFEGCTSDFTIYYTASYASEWAPNGETTWNGYPIVLLPAPISVTVTYVGDYTGTEEVPYGGDAVLPVLDAEGLHYVFTVNGEAWDGTSLTEDVTVQVTIDIDVYTVTFIDSVTGEILSVQQVEYLDPATAPAAPAHYGYTFAGWDCEFDSITADTTVTAVYTPVTFSVIFTDGMDNIISIQEVPYLSAAEEPELPVREGWVFAGWDADFGCIETSMVVNATWEPQYVTVTFIGSYTGTETLAYGADCLLPEYNSESICYIFKVDGVEWCPENVTEDVMVTVSVAAAKNTYHTVTFVGMDGEVIATVQVKHGEAATAPDAPEVPGYTFIGWDRDNFDCVTYSMTRTAVYEESQIVYHTVTFVDWDGTVLSVQQVEDGADATAPADPSREGYAFIGWDVDFSNVTEDITVTAQYEEIGPEVLVGDADGNGVLSFSDVAALYNMILSGGGLTAEQEYVCDVNGDGAVSFADVAALYNAVLGAA